MMPISEEPGVYETPVWCSIAGHSWKRATSSRDSDTLWRASRNARLRKRGVGHRKIPLTRVALAPTYASRIFYHSPTTRPHGTRHLRESHAIIRRQIRAAAVYSKFGAIQVPPSLSHTPPIRCLLGSLSSSLIGPSRFLSLLS